MTYTFSDAELAKKINQLSPKSITDLRLFVEFLLSRQQELASATPFPNNSGQRILTDMESLPIPVSTVIIDRDELYGDRIQFTDFR